jgi:hypothetical protein
MSKAKPNPSGGARRKAEAALVRSSAAEYLTFVAASGAGGVEAVYADENVWLSQKRMGLTTWKHAPRGRRQKFDVVVQFGSARTRSRPLPREEARRGAILRSAVAGLAKLLSGELSVEAASATMEASV